LQQKGEIIRKAAARGRYGERGAEKMPMWRGAREDVGLDRREEDADAGAGDSSKSIGGGAKRC